MTLLLHVLLCSGVLLGAGAPAAAREKSTTEIAKETLPAVVSIRARGAGQDASGTGFIVDGSGTIVTNLHVIAGVTTIAVKLSNGDIYDTALVRAYDERKDLAVIQV